MHSLLTSCRPQCSSLSLFASRPTNIPTPNQQGPLYCIGQLLRAVCLFPSSKLHKHIKSHLKNLWDTFKWIQSVFRACTGNNSRILSIWPKTHNFSLAECSIRVHLLFWFSLMISLSVVIAGNILSFVEGVKIILYR